MDREVFDLITKEETRQQETLNLIASENYASKQVREAVGSVLTNKYAEGYPGKRYYAGCRVIDEVERLAKKRAKELFPAEHVNVQPYSGSTANMAAYFSVLSLGDAILGMSLSHGGHLTHGAPVSFSGTLFHAVSYGVDDATGFLDYDRIQWMAKEYKPKMIVCGHSAYSRILDFKAFHTIAKSVDAYLLADISHISGLVATGLHPSPFEYADFVTTTTHKTLRGPRGAMIMCKKEYAKQVDRAVFPFLQGGPFEHVIAGKATAFAEAMHPDFTVYQKQIIQNAKALANALIDQKFHIVSGGTDNHVMVVDLTSFGITGKDLSIALEKAGIIVSKATVPNDVQSPFVTSGIRLGTPAVTTRGLKETEMVLLADWIRRVADHMEDEDTLHAIRQEVLAIAKKFPVTV